MTQDEYINILFDDLRFSLAQRKDYLASRYQGRKYADELSTEEKSRVIDALKAMKSLKMKSNKENEISGWDD